MKNWFVTNGVDQAMILIETKSLDTYQNISFGLDVLRTAVFEGAEITVLTQFQHAIRCFLTFILAHGIRVRAITIRQPKMRWKDWFMEWIILIPCHFLDWRGNFFLAKLNRRMRERAAGVI